MYPATIKQLLVTVGLVALVANGNTTESGNSEDELVLDKVVATAEPRNKQFNVDLFPQFYFPYEWRELNAARKVLYIADRIYDCADLETLLDLCKYNRRVRTMDFGLCLKLQRAKLDSNYKVNLRGHLRGERCRQDYFQNYNPNRVLKAND